MASPNTEIPASDRSESTANESPAASDATSLWVVALRDVAILAAGFSLFAAADAWHTMTGTFLSAALVLVDGLLVGVLLTAWVHEWGHFIGARISGGSAPLRPAMGFLPLFDFDYPNNTHQQFQAMSIGGNVAHWSVVLLLLAGLPLTSVGQVAITSSAFGFAIFASSIEFPVIRHVSKGLSGMEALAKIPKDFIRRNGSYGLIAALAALAVL